MKLVKYSNDPEAYLNMDYIESVTRPIDGNILAFVNRNTQSYIISEEAYNTILKYGKAEV